MKILAVRGKNLASLHGHFEVDFRAPPLDRAGLVAITGPTGAGKTTLLDAICLALFDRTPRFANRGGVTIGRAPGGAPGEGGLRANDVRGILRHGAVDGWAEVDFLGVDDRVWTARWEVRRARGRHDGRIQGQQMKLSDAVTGRAVEADRKLDVLEAIEARLGLDFDQFRRSVLLAQGEFAAFLEASGSDRAELLERMTGTRLYRELGRAAFERAKQADAELDLLRRELDGLDSLDEAARTQLKAQVEALTQARAELTRARAQAEADRTWHARLGELERGAARAKAEVEGAEQALRALDGDARTLGWIEAALPWRERAAERGEWTREADEREEERRFITGELGGMVEQRARLVRDGAAREEALIRARERRARLALPSSAPASSTPGPRPWPKSARRPSAPGSGSRRRGSGTRPSSSRSRPPWRSRGPGWTSGGPGWPRARGWLASPTAGGTTRCCSTTSCAIWAGAPRVGTVRPCSSPACAIWRPRPRRPRRSSRSPEKSAARPVAPSRRSTETSTPSRPWRPCACVGAPSTRPVSGGPRSAACRSATTGASRPRSASRASAGTSSSSATTEPGPAGRRPRPWAPSSCCSTRPSAPCVSWRPCATWPVTAPICALASPVRCAAPRSTPRLPTRRPWTRPSRASAPGC
ncbi:nuclease SbcCD, C subunit [Plesiocystis pacifica SIR-1]|uniref:Nuclease SbcCD, C subunit n=1 Tax=Plesiocystis pacifica SIR-1 TaxID=391625 RepID=A6G5S8_9BACT|nr:nuclease SbcCD, C subunit [Plesiocystis pacifica SIR-1]